MSRIIESLHFETSSLWQEFETNTVQKLGVIPYHSSGLGLDLLEMLCGDALSTYQNIYIYIYIPSATY